MNVTIRQLRAFITVANEGNFTEAAKRLHLTQSALSVLVRELENELKVRLLDRSTRKVHLSPAGKEFFPSAQRVLQELEDAVSGVTSLRNLKRGIVRVAAPQLMSCTLMPRVIAAYTREHPDISIILIDALPEQVLERVSVGAVDIGVGPEVEDTETVVGNTLFSDRHLLFCPKDHSLAAHPSVTWAQLRDYPFISQTRDFTTRLMIDLNVWSSNLVLKPAYEVSYMTTALGMVAAGLGVTACPSYAEPLAQGYGLASRPLVEPEFRREVCVFSRPSASLSPAAENFVEFLHRFVNHK
jgi:DNA-binding transcriptional LysR family regulator